MNYSIIYTYTGRDTIMCRLLATPVKHLSVVVRFSKFFFAGKVFKKLVGWYVEFFDFFDFEGCRAKKGFLVFFAALP